MPPTPREPLRDGGAGGGGLNGDPTLERIARGNGLALCAGGAWIARHAAVLEEIVTDAEKLGGSRPNIFIDVSQVSRLDTFGAWLIERLRRSLSIKGGVEAQIAGLSANYSSLVNEVRRVKEAPAADSEPVTISGMLDGVGRSVALACSVPARASQLTKAQDSSGSQAQ